MIVWRGVVRLFYLTGWTILLLLSSSRENTPTSLCDSNLYDIRWLSVQCIRLSIHTDLKPSLRDQTPSQTPKTSVHPSGFLTHLHLFSSRTVKIQISSLCTSPCSSSSMFPCRSGDPPWSTHTTGPSVHYFHIVFPLLLVDEGTSTNEFFLL